MSWVMLAAALGQIGQTRPSAGSSAGGSARSTPSAAAVVGALVAGTPVVRTPSVATGAVTGSAVFVNTAGGTLSYSAAPTSAGGGTVTLNSSTGAFTYTPTQAQRQSAGLSTSDAFTVTATNGTLTASQAITVAVDPGTPTAGAATVRTPRTATGLVTGLVWGKDSAGRALSFSAPATSAGGGAVSINAATGDFSYTPTQGQRQAAGLNTTDSFTVTISNGARTTTQSITVAVDPGLPTPGTAYVRTPSTGTGVVTGIARGTDSAGRALSFSAPSTTAAGATVAINAATGNFTYTPTQAQRQSAGASTTDSFTVTVSNGVRTATQTISVPVDPGGPVAGTPTVRTPTASAGVVTGIARFTEPFGRGLTYSVTPGSAGGGSVSINASNGNFTYTPTQAQRQNAGASTTDSFTVSVSNGLRTTTQAITVAVDPGIPVAGDPSVLAPRTATGLVTGTARATDSVGGPVTFSAPATSAGGGSVSINAATGAFTYTPTQAQRQGAGASTTDTFTVTVSNGGRTITQAITVGVDPGLPTPGTPYVRAPIAGTGVVTGIVRGTDSAGRVLSYSPVSTSSGGAAVVINPATGDFTYTPTSNQRRNAGASTTDSFTVTVSNGVRTATQTISVNVDPGSPVAGTPYLRTPIRTTGAVTGIARFTEPFGRALTYSVTPGSAGGGSVSINAGTGDFTYTPTQAQRQSAGQNTTDTFVVTATNGLRSTAQTIAVKVDPNSAPVVGNLGLTYGVNGVVNGTVTVTDANADPVTLAADTPTNGVLNAFNTSSGAFTYTPTTRARHNAAAYSASWADRNAVFTITARDGRGGVTPYQVAFTITPLNTAPTGTYTFGTASLVTGQASGTLSYTDADSDTLSYGVSVAPGKGSVAFDQSSPGAFTYTPTQQARHYAAADGVGPQSDTFTVTVDDGHGGTISIPLSVTVTPYNQPLADTATIGSPDPYEAAMVINVADPDGDIPTYTVTGLATDPFRAQTALALRMYGINNSTSFIDSSVNRYTVTPVNGAKISTARGHVDGSSGQFSRSSGSYLAVSGGTSAVPLPSGNDPYTIEAWVNPSSYPPAGQYDGAQGIAGWGNYGTTNQANAFRLATDGRLVNYWWGNDLYTASPVVPLNTWTHVAATFDGTTRRIFVNGALVASDTPTGHNVTQSDNLTIGGDAGVGALAFAGGQNFDGYIDDVRITNGARYVANFTPPAMVAPKGTVNVGVGSLTYTPDRGISHAIAEGAPALTDSFTLAADDGHGSRKTMPVNLTIGPANYAPAYSALSALTNDYAHHFYVLKDSYNANPASPQIYRFDGLSNYGSGAQSSITTRTGIGQGVSSDIAIDGQGRVYLLNGDPGSTGSKSLYRWDSLTDWASNTNGTLLGTRNSTAKLSGFSMYQDQIYVLEGDPNADGNKTLRKWNTIADWSSGQAGVALGSRATGTGIGFDIDASGCVWFLDVTAPNSSTTATRGILYTWPSANDFLANTNVTGDWLDFSFSGSLDQVGGLAVARVPQVTGTITATDAVDNDVRTYSITRGPVNGGTVSIDSATGAFAYTPSFTGRRNAATVSTGVGLAAGKWGQYQLSGAGRRGCDQVGSLCEVSGFQEAYIDSGYGWRWWDRPSWSTGDYVKLVDTGSNLWGGVPELSLIQYSSNGTQKQVIAASGYVQSLSANGVVFIGSSGYANYFLSNTVGIPRDAGESYSYRVDTLYPNRSQLASYIVNTTTLDSGQVLANTDTFVVTVADGHGGTTTTTVSVPIAP